MAVSYLNLFIPAMNFRKCNPLYGYRWFSEGIKLFIRQPWPWLALVGMTTLVLLVMSLLPVLGLVGVFLVFPGIAAGFMLASHDELAGQPISFNHLSAGFKTAPRPLLAVGGLAFAGVFLGMLVFAVGWREEFTALLELARSQATDQAALLLAMRELLIPSLLMLSVLLLMVMATWFAPALVIFKQTAPRDALRLSFKALLKNIWPFLIYAVLMLLLDVVSSFALRTLVSAVQAIGGDQVASGVAMLISFPLLCTFLSITFASAYVSYVDVFEVDKKI